MSDPFDPERFRLPAEMLAFGASPAKEKIKERKLTWDRKTGKHVPVEEARSLQKAFGLDFYQFPKGMVETLIRERAGYQVLAVVSTLFELWFTRFRKNPVSLTSRKLKECGISRHQKRRALKFLEGLGLVSIKRVAGRNPQVTINWELPGE